MNIVAVAMVSIVLGVGCLALDQSATPTPMPRPRTAPTPTFTPVPVISAPNTLLDVTSYNNVPSEKVIQLSDGRYALLKTDGCVYVQLSRTDVGMFKDEVATLSRNDLSRTNANVTKGKYTLTAMGDGCTGALSLVSTIEPTPVLSLMERESTRVASGETYVRMGPTPRPSRPTPGRGHSKAEVEARIFRLTPTPIPPTSTPTVTPTPYVIKRNMEQVAEYDALVDGYEPLTDENIEKVLNFLDTGVLNGRILSSRESRWLIMGYKAHRPVSFMQRCLTDGFEYPPLTAELEKQREHYGWDTLEFIRDGSSGSFDFMMETINPDYVPRKYVKGFGRVSNLYSVNSAYRIGDNEMVRAEMGVYYDTCEPRSDVWNSQRLAFGWEETIVDEKGNEHPKHGESIWISFWVETNRAEFYDPLTNDEVETGLIRCRSLPWDKHKCDE